MELVICILIVVLLVLYFSIRNNGPTPNQVHSENKGRRTITSETKPDEAGWKEIITEQKSERIAYIYGKINAKFYGDYDFSKDSFREFYYNIHIYEAELNFYSQPGKLISEAYGIRKQEEGSYKLEADSRFKNAIPNGIKCYVKDIQKDTNYQLTVYDPQIANVSFPSELQQIEGEETFGTLEAELIGYIKDEQIRSVSIWQKEVVESVHNAAKLKKTDIPTGEEKIYDNRIDKEFFYDDFKTKYWKSSYKSPAPSPLFDSDGCFSFLGLLFGIGILLFLLPYAPGLILIILFGILLRFLEPILKWIIPVMSLILLIGFAISLLMLFSHKKVVKYKIRTDEAKEVRAVKRDSPLVKRNPVPSGLNDSIIEHYRIWTDYQNHTYEGRIFTSVSDSIQSSDFKNNYIGQGDKDFGYDKLLSDVSINDSTALYGIYQLFDTLKKDHSDIRFAEMIISFVQDIPYVLILDKECNASLYTHPFIKHYLNDNLGECSGNEKFGINTPVEFMSNLKGDCDTRTLLVYTILKHYGFDVILLTSNIYTHSIIAINLPYEHFKLKYKFNNKQYTVCETTLKIEPGFLPDEIANMYNWRTSLKSK